MLDQILLTLSRASDLLLVVLGFSLIIVIHELGHFLAARWAGIRVLAFAVGFGPALVSYRKGLGWRRGSSEAEYKSMVQADKVGIQKADVHRVSTTEYRLNALPFGGYVKMLGQDDSDATVRSDEPDSYQTCKVWKRMIVISAGVVMNILLAGLLFVIVFMAGLDVEAPKVGFVDPDFPAGKAVAVNAKELGVTEPGLKPGDLVLRIDGGKPANFNDLFLASAMASPGKSIRVEVQREGIPTPLLFDITPKRDDMTKMLQLGIGPAASRQLLKPTGTAEDKALNDMLTRAGFGAVPSGAYLVRVGDDTTISSAYELLDAARKSGGAPVPVEFSWTPGDGSHKGPGRDTFTGEMKPRREMEGSLFRIDANSPPARVPHVLGLMPVMGVGAVTDRAKEAGLRAGDVFAQIGSVEWPSLPEGIAEIRRSKGSKIRVVVVRKDEAGADREVTLENVPVNREGQIGFNLDDSSQTSTRVTNWPASLAASVSEDGTQGDRREPASASLNLLRGSRITKVGDRAVTNLEDVTNALIDSTRTAFESSAERAEVALTVVLPVKSEGAAAEQTLTWSIPRDELKSLHSLSWLATISPGWFEPEKFIQKANGPFDAIGMGIAQTRSVMTSTYVTFARLFQGSVKIEHLKGPVGIADVGTKVARKGFVWLLFFLALISVNLAVVNFLPIPIADGGHFLFLLYEQITGKPVSVAVQNVAAIAGLMLVIGMFLLVTYNDIANLIGR